MMSHDKLTVLFVEDDRIDRFAIERAATREDWSCNCTFACCLAEAEQALSAGRFDAVVSDYHLGDGTALDVLALAGDIPMVVVTGAGDEEIAVGAMKAGACDYLVKDPDGNYLKILPVTMERAIRQRRDERELAAYRERLEAMVTERSAALLDAQKQMHQQERLAAVGQLAAGIAHDFNNMLSVIMGLAQILDRQENVPDAIKKDARVIFSQGERAAQLIRQILDFSRQTEADRQPMDLAPFLKEIGKLLDRTLPETIRVQVVCSGETFHVEGNLTQLQQVITNLAVNARDAMPGGGELEIALSRMRLGAGECPPAPGMKPGEWTVWTVSDTGCGMPPEVLARLYEPFFTTRARGEGTGLGLAQVYGIVKQHGGEIVAESEAGKGTRFTIYLPLIATEEAHAQPEEMDLPKGRGETILVVEDESSVRTILKAMIELLDYRALTAANGREALDVYRAHQNEIAAVLTDLVMPEMGGVALCQALREINPDLSVLVMTGYAAEDSASLLREGVSGLLHKPMVLEEVAQALRQALERDDATGPRNAQDGGR